MKYVDLGVKIKDTLIISDLHIGYEEALNKKGILIPRTKKLYNRLKKLLEKTKPKIVVVAGDFKHEFGTISEQEWRDSLKVIDLITKNSKLILIKGNHDKIMGPIAKKRNVEIKEKYEFNDTMVCHGNKIIQTKKNNIVCGHEHPAITLREDAKKEKYKCFVETTYKKKKVIILPSFNEATEGTDVLEEKHINVYLKNKKRFHIIITHKGEIYDFGMIKGTSISS